MIKLEYTKAYMGIPDPWEYDSIQEMRTSKQNWNFNHLAEKIALNNELISKNVEELYDNDWDNAFDSMDLTDFCMLWNNYSEDWCNSKGIIPVWRMTIEC